MPNLAPRRILSIVFASLVCCLSACAASPQQVEAQKEIDMNYNMAVNYFEVGETAQAIRSLALVLAEDPKHAEANHLMGFIRMGRKQYDVAIKHFKQTLEVSPNKLTCKNNLAVAYMFQERWEDAAVIFQELSKSPLYTSPWLAFGNLGWAYYKMHMLPEALEQTEMAIFLNPKFCLGLNNLGIIYNEMGNVKEAKKHLDEATLQCTNYAEPHLHLGLIFAKEGEVAKAHKSFKKCAKLSPKNELGERCQANAEALGKTY